MFRVPRVEVLGHERIENDSGRFPDVIPGSIGGSIRIVDGLAMSATTIF
jgi:hypothetical protein